MSATVSEVLRERFVRRLLVAWPERDVSEESIRAALSLMIRDDAEGPNLVASLLGYTISSGYFPDREIEEVADELADNLAANCEDDRWSGPEAWRKSRQP